MSYLVDFSIGRADLYRAAIDAWMAKLAATLNVNYHIECTKGIDGYHVNFTPASRDRFWSCYKGVISYPDRNGLHGGDVVSGRWESNYGASGADPFGDRFRVGFENVRAQIGSLLEPWASLPDPSEFDATIDGLATISNILDITGSGGAGNIGHAGDNYGVLGTPYQDEIVARYEDAFHGVSFDVVYHGFVTKLPQKFLDLDQEIGAFYAYVAVEKELWARTRTSVIQAMTQATEAFRACVPSPAGGNVASAVLAIFGFVFALVAAIPTGGTSLAIAAAVATAANAVIGAAQYAIGVEPTKGVDGGSFDEILQNLARVLDTGSEHNESIGKAVHAVEQGIRDKVSARLETIYNDPTLKLPDPFSGEGVDPALVGKNPYVGDESDFVTPMIGDGLSSRGFFGVLADGITQQADALRGLIGSSSAWVRDGRIGYNTSFAGSGPFSVWAELGDALVAMFVVAAERIENARSGLRKLVTAYEEADKAQAAKFDALVKEMGILEQDMKTYGNVDPYGHP